MGWWHVNLLQEKLCGLNLPRQCAPVQIMQASGKVQRWKVKEVG
jgi:hypothetical protein